MAKQLISMSPDGKQEYCCNIVKIEELQPIEGSDFLARTYLNGDSIVVRKDQVKVGDYYFYASNECELSEKFLAANNLFDASTWEMNSNAEEVRPLKTAIEMHKDTIAKNKKDLKDLMKLRRTLEIQNPEKKMTELKKVRKMLSRYGYYDESNNISEDTEELRQSVLSKIKHLNEENTQCDKDIENIRTEIKKHVGFFNKYGRVKCIRLKGIPSYGFIFSKTELAKAFPEMENFNMEENLGIDFDTIGDELFIKAYIPRVKSRPERTHKGQKAARKMEKKIDRMVPGEFIFHYDTNPLGKNMEKIDPRHKIIVTTKVHGTSFIMSNCKVKVPIKLNIFKKAINAIAKIFKTEVFPTYYLDYDEVYSSRKVIKNKNLNKNQGSGYYSSDIWGYWANLLKGQLPKGMTLYAEIAGYLPEDTGKMIQSPYDYGCEAGQSKLMPYRISTVDEDGNRHEWNIEDVYNWTVELMEKNPELAPNIMPIDILYHGQAKDLYPEINTSDLHAWRNSFYLEFASDADNFGMEQTEPLCRNELPREGVVVRIDDDEFPEAFKVKTTFFREWERGMVDNGQVDIEMLEGYDVTDEG